MKMINFGMHGWVIGKATLKAHPFTMNLNLMCTVEGK